MVPTLQYEAARSLIQDGDLLSFVPNDKKILHVATQKVTKSDYYHSGIAVWMNTRCGASRLFVCEATRSGRHVIPLSCYRSYRFDVTACPVEFCKFEDNLLERVGKVPYGFLDFITVGARNLFGITLKDANGEICSEVVQKQYSYAGMSMPSYILSPGELYEYMKACGIQDRVHVVQ